jgi:hypothetical protein
MRKFAGPDVGMHALEHPGRAHRLVNALGRCQVMAMYRWIVLSLCAACVVCPPCPEGAACAICAQSALVFCDTPGAFEHGKALTVLGPPSDTGLTVGRRYLLSGRTVGNGELLLQAIRAME